MLLHLQVNKSILWGNVVLQRQKQLRCYCMSLTGGCESTLMPGETGKLPGQNDSELLCDSQQSSSRSDWRQGTVPRCGQREVQLSRSFPCLEHRVSTQ